MKNKKILDDEKQVKIIAQKMAKLIKNTAHQIAAHSEDGSFSISEIETQLNSKRHHNDQLPDNEIEYFISEMINWGGELLYNFSTKRYKVELNVDAWEMINEVAWLQTAIDQTAHNRFQSLTTEESWRMAISLQKNLILKRQAEGQK